MALLNLEAETYAILHELDGLYPRDGVVIANAMMGAAMCFLTRLAGHDAVAMQLRADADTVASYAPRPGEPQVQSGMLN